MNERTCPRITVARAPDLQATCSTREGPRAPLRAVGVPLRAGGRASGERLRVLLLEGCACLSLCGWRAPVLAVVCSSVQGARAPDLEACLRSEQRVPRI